MNTPGYHRYMRGVWFLAGMTFSLTWPHWWLAAVAVFLVAGRAARDIIQEERAEIRRADR